MAFSQGAALAAGLLVYQIQQDSRAQLPPAFRCTVFSSGAEPEDPQGVRGKGPRRVMCYQEDDEVIHLPTTHTWDGNDKLFPHSGPVMSCSWWGT